MRADRPEGFSKAIRHIRANITWRQDVGGSSIEASKIVGHSKVDTTTAGVLISTTLHAFLPALAQMSWIRR
jgi:hypothetical protein